MSRAKQPSSNNSLFNICRYLIKEELFNRAFYMTDDYTEVMWDIIIVCGMIGMTIVVAFTVVSDIVERFMKKKRKSKFYHLSQRLSTTL